MKHPTLLAVALLIAFSVNATTKDQSQSEPSTVADVGAAGDVWTQVQGETDGEAFVYRVLRKLPDRWVQASHPQRLILGLAYDEEGSMRLPNKAEWRRIDAYAKAFNAAANHAGAISVGSSTSDGFHQYIFYCSDPAQAQVRLMGALADVDKIDSHAEVWEVTDEPDAEWSYIRQISVGP